MIQEKISLDLHKAIVEKDTVRKDLLRVILAEMCRYTKNATDEEAIKVLKKGIENASLNTSKFVYTPSRHLQNCSPNLEETIVKNSSPCC